MKITWIDTHTFRIVDNCVSRTISLSGIKKPLYGFLLETGTDVLNGYKMTVLWDGNKIVDVNRI